MTKENEKQLEVIREQLAKNADEVRAIENLQVTLKFGTKILKMLDNDDELPKTWQECLADEVAIANDLQAVYQYQKHIDEYHLEGYEKAVMQRACLETINAFSNYLSVIANIQNNIYEKQVMKESDK
uniref:hypothetical protein n=1 Tax=Lactobacillus acidophilus TaxID=1579 RepID=UPI003F55B17E